MLSVTEEDLASLNKVLASGLPAPKVKISIYKNRRGKYKGVYLWCRANLSTCRVDPIFMTDYSYELIPIEDTKIIVEN